MSYEFAEFEEEMREAFQKSRDAFEGRFAGELEELLCLSGEELSAIIPDTMDLWIYDALIVLVKDASRRNYSEADFKSKVENLGSVAIDIATLCPKLHRFF